MSLYAGEVGVRDPQGRTGTRRAVRWFAVVASLCALAACSWGQPGYDAGRAGWSSGDGSFTTSNVSSTSLLWQADGATSSGFGVTVPAMDAQHVFFTSGPKAGPGVLEGFDGDGGPDCAGSPRVCKPLWLANLPMPVASGPIVGNGMVFVGGNVSNTWTVLGFDAAGVRRCSGTPVVCQPLWRASWSGGTSNAALYLMTAGDTLFATAEDLRSSAGSPSSVFAFDMTGAHGCSGTAPTTCAALFSVASGGGVVYPSVAAGLLFVPRSDGVGAYDATGVSGCTGTPKVCQPLWRAATPGNPAYAVVSGGVLYAQVLVPPRIGVPWTGTVYAFDASGKLGCGGAPKVCGPRFTSASGLIQLPVVADGHVFVATGDQSTGMSLESFSATGTSGCTGVVPSCAHLSTAALPGGAVRLAATKSVLFTLVGGNGLPDSGRLMAYALDGTNCSPGSPTLCSPLLSVPTAPSAVGLAVANGRLATVVASPRVNAPALVVYGLPS